MKSPKMKLVAASLVVAVVVAFVLSSRRQSTPVQVSEKSESVALAAVPSVVAPIATNVAVQAEQIPTSRGTLPYIVSSAVPFDKPLRLAMEAFGAKTVASDSPKAMIIEATPAVRARLAADKRFEKIEELAPSSKIQPALAALVKDGAKEVEVAIVTLSAADREAVLGKLATNGGELLEGCINEGATIRAKMPSDAVAKLVMQGEVRWMERFLRPQIMNDLAVNEPMMNVRMVWDPHGLTGAGQHISTSDTGIDSGNRATLHEDLRKQVKDIQVVTGCDKSDKNGHGTHTAGSIVGNGAKSDGQIKGTAYEANLYAWFCSKAGGVHTPDTLDGLYQNGGAWTTAVHSASWGSNVYGEYTTECADHDRYVWEHPEFLPVFSAGNSGCGKDPNIIIPSSIGSPASAKNVLTVGATQSSRPDHDEGWGNGDPTKTVSFSSRGPCLDGRTKPDIAAPGCGILSTRSHGVDYSYGIYDEFYAYDSGTSMSCPLTAGAVVLVRQWLVERMGFDGAEVSPGVTNRLPTAALMKAVITGGAKGAPEPNQDQGWGRVDLEETLFPSNRAVKLVDRIPFAAGFVTNIVIETTNAAPLDVQLVWVDYPGNSSGSQESSRLVNDLDLIVESADAADDLFMWGNGGTEPDTLNNVESVRIASAPAKKYVITVNCKRILHDCTEGGAAALYIRGAFDPAATPEIPKRVHLTDRNADFYTLDSALNAVTNDGEVVTILDNTIFLNPVIVTNSCTVSVSGDWCVRCTDNALLTASGAGVNVWMQSIAFTNTCAGFVADAGSTVKVRGCWFDNLNALVAAEDSHVEVTGGDFGDLPAVSVATNGTMRFDTVLSIRGNARSLVVDAGGSVLFVSTFIEGVMTEDWSVAGRFVLQGSQLATNQSVTVAANGSLELIGSVGHLASITLEEATRTSLTLGELVSITERVLVTAPNAYTNGAIFGQYTCNNPTAVECGRYFVDALDPEGELGGLPNSADGTMRWGVVEAPEAAAGASVKTGDVTKYYYTLKSALRASQDNEAEVKLLFDSVFTNTVTLTHNKTLSGKNGAVLFPQSTGQFIVPEGVSLAISDLAVNGDGATLNDCLFKVTGGTLTLGSGTKITGISDVSALNKSYGGLITVTKGLLTMERGVLISDCRSHANGGAIWVGGANSRANLVGGTIEDCSAFMYGGAVYACSKATVGVGGDFTATSNKRGTGAETWVSNLYLSRDSKFTLAEPLSGSIGISFGKKNGYADLNLAGACFADYDREHMAVSQVVNSVKCLSSDADSLLIGSYDGAADEIVWAAVPPDDGQCPEDEAFVKVEVEGESTPRYYEWLEDAFAYVNTNAVFYVRAPKPGHDFSDWISTDDVQIGYRALVTKWDGDGRPVIGRANEMMIHVLPGGDLTLSNVAFYGVYELPNKSNSRNGLITVEGGALTLAADSFVGKVTGQSSRASNAIAVWKGGTFTMLPGSMITGSDNVYSNAIDATSCGGGVLLDRSTAYLRGGEVSGCSAYRGGGVYVANESIAYISGGFTAKNNRNLSSAADNIVVSDNSRIIVDDEFTGAVGYNEGIAADTNWFATVTWEWPNVEALTNAAARFTHDKTGAVGAAVTNGVDTTAVLVWSDWLSKAGAYVDPTGAVYRVCLTPGQTLAVPKAFSVSQTTSASGKLSFSITGGVEGCWYTVYAADALDRPFVPVKTVQLASDVDFVFEVDASKSAQYYKIVAEEGIR